MSVIALAGNPNCGKTSLFNRLTGLNQRVGNYPGITVERRSGHTRVDGAEVEVVDLPGTYSLIAQSRDEAIAFEVVAGLGPEQPPDLTIVVLDATNLLRNLYVALGVIELGRPVVVALNMMDLARERGLDIDAEALAQALGVPVVPVVARSGEGVDALERALAAALKDPLAAPERAWRLDGEGERLIEGIRAALPAPHDRDGVACWVLATVAAGSDAVPEALAAGAEAARVGLRTATTPISESIVEARYAAAREVVSAAVRAEDRGARTPTDRIDAVLLHPVLGLVAFLAVMTLLFQSIFAWADPLMGLIEDGVAGAQGALRTALPEGALTDLLADGVVGGVGNVIVFVPQIAFLFAFIAILEDSGYLARAAFISDRLMARVGLHGRAFVPLLSGFACAVPAIMATRSIESPKDRLVTILVTPLVSCSARLPVYTLIIAALFSPDRTVLGVFSVGGLLMLAMYLLSIVFTVGVAFVLKRTILKSPTPPLVLELPPYRMPEPRSVLVRVIDRCLVFVKDAGTVILACSMVLWALLYFPSEVPEDFHLEAKRARIEQTVAAPEARAEALETLHQEAESARVQASVAGRVGHALEPVFAPLGYDWKMVVGILASFAAREVLVSTLGLVYGVGDEVDEESVPLREKLQREVDPVTGEKVYTPLVGLSLMVFFVLALQCMSTLAAIRRETMSWRWPLFAFGYASVLAWVMACLVYQGGRLLGFA